MRTRHLFLKELLSFAVKIAHFPSTEVHAWERVGIVMTRNMTRLCHADFRWVQSSVLFAGSPPSSCRRQFAFTNGRKGMMRHLDLLCETFQDLLLW